MSIRTSEGMSLSATAQAFERIATEIRKLPGVTDTLSTVGGGQQTVVNSGSIYVKLAEIADRPRSQQDLMSDVRNNILQPLGLAATTLEPGSVPKDRIAVGYRWEDNQWKEEPQLPDGAFGAMGGMLTSTADLAKYVAFMMSAWPPRDSPDTQT